MKKNDTNNKAINGIPRRDFLKKLGGGIFLFFVPWPEIEASSISSQQVRRTLPKDYNAFLQITEDGTINCYTGKIEMGQGVITSLPLMMADELNVPLEKVKIVMGDTDLCPWDAGTWGSQTTQAFGPAMRAAAAEARVVLVDMAAAKLGVPSTQLEVKDGVITDSKNPKNTVSYGQLAKGKKLEKFLDVKPAPETFDKFTYVGKPYFHSDAVQKVTGAAKYALDLRIPGMVYARILRPPSHGAKLKSADWSGAEKVQGTTVIHDGDLVAVLNENRDRADEAVVKIKADYTFNEMPVNDKTIHEWFMKAEASQNVIRSKGDPDAGAQASEKVFESEFRFPYLAHAPIETHTALAEFKDDKVTIWAATQSPFGLQDAVARELSMPLEKVRVITPFVGGGFGGKSMYTQGVEAAKLAKLSGKPVMVHWTRDEEFFYDIFHAASVIKVKSGVDKDGLIKLWDYTIYMAGTRGSETLYEVPNDKATNISPSPKGPAIHPVATGPWRGPNAQDNTFARESQIDMMASYAGIDPLEFRLKNLKDEKMIACLKAVADKFGYTPAKGPSGRGIGIAVGTDAGTWVAEMAEVKVDRNTGKVEVVRIACAQDMGLCVNPQGATIQMEGCMTMGLGFTFTEEVFFEGGNVLDRGYDSYKIPKFSWLPKIDTVILDRKDKAPKGGGEPAIVPVAAVIANAIFDATGARLYRFPMTPERVMEAMGKR
ncbi:MAG TPA: molybdopterin cofactor-binding domain-containing protein [Bacteroidales bacterium]|nr:molybdopterin cofactor-binding domain-containing protein [Bacteroidales bacterium]